MDIFEAQITAAESGTRLDTYLAAILDGISRSYIQKLISEQYILINSRPVKANYKIKTADQVFVAHGFGYCLRRRRSAYCE